MNPMQRAIIRRDIRSITDNKRMLTVMIIVPIVMAIFLPAVFILTFYFTPEEWGELDTVLKLLARSFNAESFEKLLLDFLLNRVMPMFFMMIPIMAASVMASSAFVGEKEKKTLETLLYCPLSVGQILASKVMASFLVGMAVSLLAFLSMVIVVYLLTYFTFGFLPVLGSTWISALAFLSPVMSLLAITLTVLGSAKAKTVEEAQQRASYMILPVMMLMAGQFTGLYLINAWTLLAIGGVALIITALLVKRAAAKFTYEKLIA